MSRENILREQAERGGVFTAADGEISFHVPGWGDVLFLLARVRELEEASARLIATLEGLPGVVFASDDKEREMFAKGVVLNIVRAARGDSA